MIAYALSTAAILFSCISICQVARLDLKIAKRRARRANWQGLDGGPPPAGPVPQGVGAEAADERVQNGLDVERFIRWRAEQMSLSHQDRKAT